MSRGPGLLPGAPAPAPAAVFRRESYSWLGRRADALFEVREAVLCTLDRVHMLAERSPEPERCCGLGAVYVALRCGQVQVARLR